VRRRAAEAVGQSGRCCLILVCRRGHWTQRWIRIQGPERSQGEETAAGDQPHGIHRGILGYILSIYEGLRGVDPASPPRRGCREEEHRNNGRRDKIVKSGVL
jgi:hypothetical protein